MPTIEQLANSCGLHTPQSRKTALFVGIISIIQAIIIIAKVIYFSMNNSSGSISENNSSERLADSMSRLRRDLFKNYDKLIPPIVAPREPVEMAFGLALINIDMEKDGTVVLDTWLRCNWHDFRLKWDPSSYGNVSLLRLPADQLWLPDITLYNEKGLADSDSNKHLLGKSDVNYLVYSDGEVLHIPPITMKSHCLNGSSHGLQKDWPWGEHLCKFKFGSWTYDGFILNLTRYNEKAFVDMSDFIKGPVKIVNNTLTRNEKYYDCCDEPYLDLTATLTLQKLYRVEQSGNITYNPFIDKGDIGNQNYSNWEQD